MKNCSLATTPPPLCTPPKYIRQTMQLVMLLRTCNPFCPEGFPGKLQAPAPTVTKFYSVLTMESLSKSTKRTSPQGKLYFYCIKGDMQFLNPCMWSVHRRSPRESVVGTEMITWLIVIFRVFPLLETNLLTSRIGESSGAVVWRELTSRD